MIQRACLKKGESECFLNMRKVLNHIIMKEAQMKTIQEIDKRKTWIKRWLVENMGKLSLSRMVGGNAN